MGNCLPTKITIEKKRKHRLPKMDNSKMCQMEQELKKEPRAFKTLARSGGFEVDDSPLEVGDAVFIMLSPQNIVCEFEKEVVEGLCSYTLVDTVHINTYIDIIAVKAKQLIIPLVKLSEINQQDAILHYKADEEFHLRIATGQYEKMWSIAEGRLNLWSQETTRKQWTIQVTNHNFWST
jgi:hypothetical protein